MIQLFNIPRYKIDTSEFSNIINDKIVDKFIEDFCEYVGAKYGCGFNSATNAIYLSMLGKNETVEVPSLLPHVVVNALLLSDNKVKFRDDVTWVGDSYVLHRFNDYKIIDSAQKVERNQFVKEAEDNDLMIFSFYPTKPVGSADGGIIVSNDKSKIDWFINAVNNGAQYSLNNWDKKILFPGWKMYLSTLQAKIAMENLKVLDKKQDRIAEIRETYNLKLGYNNTSSHLYRVNVDNRDTFIERMKSLGITCGIHYRPLHLEQAYISHPNVINHDDLKLSESISLTTTSLPMHENLSDYDVNRIIECYLALVNDKHV